MGSCRHTQPCTLFTSGTSGDLSPSPAWLYPVLGSGVRCHGMFSLLGEVAFGSFPFATEKMETLWFSVAEQHAGVAMHCFLRVKLRAFLYFCLVLIFPLFLLWILNVSAPVPPPLHFLTTIFSWSNHPIIHPCSRPSVIYFILLVIDNLLKTIKKCFLKRKLEIIASYHGAIQTL